LAYGLTQRIIRISSYRFSVSKKQELWTELMLLKINRFYLMNLILPIKIIDSIMDLFIRMA